MDFLVFIFPYNCSSHFYIFLILGLFIIYYLIKFNNFLIIIVLNDHS